MVLLGRGRRPAIPQVSGRIEHTAQTPPTRTWPFFAAPAKGGAMIAPLPLRPSSLASIDDLVMLDPTECGPDAMFAVHPDAL